VLAVVDSTTGDYQKIDTGFASTLSHVVAVDPSTTYLFVPSDSGLLVFVNGGSVAKPIFVFVLTLICFSFF